MDKNAIVLNFSNIMKLVDDKKQTKKLILKPNIKIASDKRPLLWTSLHFFSKNFAV